MIIDATFWVAISFFIFFGVLIYLKVPQKMNNLLSDQIKEIKKVMERREGASVTGSDFKRCV